MTRVAQGHTASKCWHKIKDSLSPKPVLLLLKSSGGLGNLDENVYRVDSPTDGERVWGN